MTNWRDEKKLPATVIFGLLLPGMLALVLAGAAYAQTDRQTGFQNLLGKSPHLEMSAPLPARAVSADYLTPELHRALLRELTASRWWQTNLPDPLVPKSVFATRTNPGNYLNRWPTPGLTVSPEEPSQREELTDDDLM